MTQWVPFYESDMDTVKSELATFFDVFPNGTVWANELNGGGYDVFLMGQNQPAKINLDALEQRLESPPIPAWRNLCATSGSVRCTICWLPTQVRTRT